MAARAEGGSEQLLVLHAGSACRLQQGREGGSRDAGFPVWWGLYGRGPYAETRRGWGDCPRVATAGPVGLARPRTLKGPVRVRLLRPGNDVRGYGVFAKGERERGTVHLSPSQDRPASDHPRGTVYGSDTEVVHAGPSGKPLRLPDPYRHGSGTGIPPISDRVELPQPEAETAGRTARHTAPLSSYTPRHSWATAARDRGVPLAVISAGMGHSSEKTTLIYLDSLDNAVIDNANERILRDLNDTVSK